MGARHRGPQGAAADRGLLPRAPVHVSAGLSPQGHARGRVADPRDLHRAWRSWCRTGCADLQIPTALRAAAIGERVQLGDYLALDDIALLSCFRAWEAGGDPVLAELTTSLARRDLPKTVPLKPDGAPARGMKRSSRASEVALRRGLPPISPCARRPLGRALRGARRRVARRAVGAHPPPADSALGPHARSCSDQLRNQRIERPRLIFPSSVRDEVLAALEGVIG